MCPRLPAGALAAAGVSKVSASVKLEDTLFSQFRDQMAGEVYVAQVLGPMPC